MRTLLHGRCDHCRPDTPGTPHHFGGTRCGISASLRQVTAPGGPVVVYVHGPAGIGKTALISALDACLEDEGVRRLHIAAGAVEPTPTAILMALGRVLDHEARTVAELAAALASSQGRHSRHGRRCRHLAPGSFLASGQDLLPALPASTRFVLAGTVPPPPAWSIGYGQYFLDIKLAALPRAESDAAVAAAGLSAEIAERIWRLSGGHPLGLRMAIHAARTGSLGTARDAGELANAILRRHRRQRLAPSGRSMRHRSTSQPCPDVRHSGD